MCEGAMCSKSQKIRALLALKNWTLYYVCVGVCVQVKCNQVVQDFLWSTGNLWAIEHSHRASSSHEWFVVKEDNGLCHPGWKMQIQWRIYLWSKEQEVCHFRKLEHLLFSCSCCWQWDSTWNVGASAIKREFISLCWSVRELSNSNGVWTLRQGHRG